MAETAAENKLKAIASNNAKNPQASFNHHLAQLAAYCGSRSCRLVVKASLGLLACFIFVILGENVLPYYVQSSVVLVAVIHNTSRPFGTFLSSTILLILGVLAGGAIWCIIEFVAASHKSEPGMVILLFMFTYLTSLLRARYPPSFTATIVMSLLIFQAVNSSVMSDGASTIPQLLYYMAAFGIGILICFLVNTLFFPTFSDVQWALRDMLISSGKALNLILKSYILESTTEDVIERKKVVSALRTQLGMVSSALDQSEYEFRFSILTNSELRNSLFRPRHFSAPLADPLNSSVRQISVAVEQVAAVISPDRKQTDEDIDRDQTEPSLLRSNTSNNIRSEDVPLSRMDAPLSSVVIDVSEAHSEEESPSREYSNDPGKIARCAQVLSEAMANFEERQMNFMKDLLESDPEAVNPLIDETYEQIVEANFFVLALREYVAELKTIHHEALADWIYRKRKLHLPAIFSSWFSYLSKFIRRNRIDQPKDLEAHRSIDHAAIEPLPYDGLTTDSEDWDATINSGTSTAIAAKLPPRSLQEGQSYAPQRLDHPTLTDPRWRIQKRSLGLKFIMFLESLLSTPSVYAFKVATVITLVTLILLYERAFFVAWGLQSTVIIIFVTCGPVLGQTYSSFFYFLVGCVIGNLLSYVSFIVWKLVPPVSGQAQVNPYGFCFMVLIIGLIFFHVFLSTPYSSFGLLTLVSFAIPAAGQYTNIVQPGPLLYFYRQLAAVAMAVTFVLIFNVIIFPNLARHQLRAKMSHILGHLQELHTEILRFAFSYYADPADTTANSLSVQTDLATADPSSSSSPPQPTQPQRHHHRHHYPPELTYASLLNTVRRNAVSISQLSPLLTHAAVEPRLAGPLETSDYREIITGLQSFIDRTGTCLSCIGPKGFSISIASSSPEVRKARRELSGVVGLRLYVYAAALLHKQPLPYYLPSARAARDHVFSLYVQRGRQVGGGGAESFLFVCACAASPLP
ncbi:hypothetical protein BJ742DRAFT_212820 [Cladochytrium replicatum]|nr:hypothetical protein BJ742DRAFT_212820 [Cladochytrium replicatum]